MREHTGGHWRPQHAAGLCGRQITTPAGVVVTRGATVTIVRIDAPDPMGSRGGLGTLVRMWQALLPRCRRMGLFD